MSFFSKLLRTKSTKSSLAIETLEDRSVPTVGLTEAFVASTYQTLLRRDAEPGGIQYWSSVAQTKGTDAVIQGIQNSAEHEGIEVRDLYEGVLGRKASDAEVKYWVGQRQAGHTEDEVVAAVYGSGEFANKTGHSTTQALDQIYKNELGRGLDDGGGKYWSGMVASGVSMSDVALQIMHSDEGRQHDVRDVYMQMLGRTAESGGVAYWTAIEKQGRGHDDVVAGVLNSDEARQHLQGVISSQAANHISDDANVVAHEAELEFHLSDDLERHDGGVTLQNDDNHLPGADDVLEVRQEDRTTPGADDFATTSTGVRSVTPGADDFTTSSTGVQTDIPGADDLTSGGNHHSGSGHL